jgi:hypothetical protein
VPGMRIKISSLMKTLIMKTSSLFRGIRDDFYIKLYIKKKRERKEIEKKKKCP